MTVYVDDLRAPFGRMKLSHMIADSREELDAMADRIGVARRWIQNAGTYREHYDVSMQAAQKAVLHGAQQVTQRELGSMLVSRRAPRSPAPAGERTETVEGPRGFAVGKLRSAPPPAPEGT